MRFLFVLFVLSVLSFSPAIAESIGVVVLRHAEKADPEARDPGLSPAGRLRAEALARTLENAPVGSLIATQYRRTRETLEVIARQRNLEIEVVEAEADTLQAHVAAIVSRVKQHAGDGVIVIAGHSNTAPLIVEALSGQAVSPIAEHEYDRLFLLLPGSEGMAVVSARYGEPAEQLVD